MGPFCLENRRLREDFVNVYKYLREDTIRCLWAPLKRACLQDERQWAQNKMQEVLSELQEILFYCVGDQSTRTGCTERLWSLSPWRYSKGV